MDESRVAELEHRMNSLERSRSHYRLALVAVVLALVGVACTSMGNKNVTFDTVTVRTLRVESDAGKEVALLKAMGGDGALYIYNNLGINVVTLRAVGGGSLSISNNSGQGVVGLGSRGDGGNPEFEFDLSDMPGWVAPLRPTKYDGGYLIISNNSGKFVADLSADETGGYLNISNKTGKEVVQAYADEYGNGVVGAYNHKRKGRMLKPGP